VAYQVTRLVMVWQVCMECKLCNILDVRRRGRRRERQLAAARAAARQRPPGALRRRRSLRWQRRLPPWPPRAGSSTTMTTPRPPKVPDKDTHAPITCQLVFCLSTGSYKPRPMPAKRTCTWNSDQLSCWLCLRAASHPTLGISCLANITFIAMSNLNYGSAILLSLRP
jgi:hypothetical protein